MIRLALVCIKGNYLLTILLFVFLFHLASVCVSTESRRCVEYLPIETRGDTSYLLNMRNNMASHVKSALPSPHAELVLGMVLGLDEFKNLPTFNDILIASGTIHVVVVSGYNLNLIFTFLLKVFGSNLKISTLFLTQLFAVIYAVISGFEPPVVRALIMVSVITWGFAFGRKLNIYKVFLFSILLMLSVNPSYIHSLSFQLSGLASLGLLLVSPHLNVLLFKFTRVNNVLLSSFVETTAAQSFVFPLIAYHFGRISLISLLTNTLTLWTVPYITVLGVIVLASSYMSLGLGRLLGILVLPFSYLFVKINYYISLFSDSGALSHFSLKELVVYYLTLTLILVMLRKSRFESPGRAH